ncbi:MAG: sn-glycerol-1-phosphate dehydrogenase [Paenibacillaceae bacterium]
MRSKLGLFSELIANIVVNKQAIDQVVPYLNGKAYRNIVMIADKNTYAAAGSIVQEQCMEAGLVSRVILIHPNSIGDVVADEASIVQCMLEISADTEVLLAVGTGTIHDIVRFVGSRMMKPFISIPTAASVDGFTSAGAPLIIRGFKQTIQAIPPEAIFADTTILMNAPKQLTAAGFGDMFGKYTSLFDWRFSHLMGGEPYNEELAAETSAALEACIVNIDAISRGDEEGVTILMNSLIQSGLVMLKLGMSHPASGAEHHLSHYWEMEHIQHGEPQLLHGLKVGFAAIHISKLYHQFADRMDRMISNETPVTENMEQQRKLMIHWNELRAGIAAIPQPEKLTEMLTLTGGSPDQLSISTDAVERGLEHAHTVRNRYTLLRFINEEVNK